MVSLERIGSTCTAGKHYLDAVWKELWRIGWTLNYSNKQIFRQQGFVRMNDIVEGLGLGETSKFPFCDHKQTTKDDKRR